MVSPVTVSVGEAVESPAVGGTETGGTVGDGETVGVIPVGEPVGDNVGTELLGTFVGDTVGDTVGCDDVGRTMFRIKQAHTKRQVSFEWVHSGSGGD